MINLRKQDKSINKAPEENFDRSIVLKRSSLIFNDEDCEVISISDITSLKQLQEKEKTHNLLKALNATVHHEMLAPLKANAEASKFLSEFSKDEKDRELAYAIHISNRLLLNHMQDLLDHSIISNDGFMPKFSCGSITDSINEVVVMMR